MHPTTSHRLLLGFTSGCEETEVKWLVQSQAMESGLTLVCMVPGLDLFHQPIPRRHPSPSSLLQSFQEYHFDHVNLLLKSGIKL